MKILRNPAQYAQWIAFFESLAGWLEREAIARISCPRLVYFGAEGDLIEAGMPVNIASNIRRHRESLVALVALGWQVHEAPGQSHADMALPAQAVPPVLAFLDGVLAVPVASTL